MKHDPNDGLGGGGPGGEDDDGAGGEGAGAERRGGLAALAPRGPWQVAVAVLAVCFLAGAVGYLLGTRTTTAANEVDVGFLEDMLDHHDQAVTMALCTVDKATDPTVRSFAKEVLVFQRWDIGVMETLLDQQGRKRPDTDRQAMTWMGMATPATAMPGMASADAVDRLCRATGVDVDRQFLTLMTEHHRGGVHMAGYAADHAETTAVRTLARSMADNQTKEVAEYQRALQRLGT